MKIKPEMPISLKIRKIIYINVHVIALTGKVSILSYNVTSTSTSILSRTEYQYNAQSARNNKVMDKKC